MQCAFDRGASISSLRLRPTDIFGMHSVNFIDLRKMLRCHKSMCAQRMFPSRRLVRPMGCSSFQPFLGVLTAQCTMLTAW